MHDNIIFIISHYVSILYCYHNDVDGYSMYIHFLRFQYFRVFLFFCPYILSYIDLYYDEATLHMKTTIVQNPLL